MKKTPLERSGSSPVSVLKRKIQAQVREIVILRDEGCLLKGFRFACNPVLQADHLITRGKNIGYAETRLIICLCKGHHTAKTFDDTGDYETEIRRRIGKDRAKLWDRFRADRKPYSMGEWEWAKVSLALQEELKLLEK